MPNDENLLKFLEKSSVRVGRLLRNAKAMKNGVGKFQNVAEDLESLIKGSKVHFYGTRAMQLGHEKSHLNIFLEVGM